MDRIEAVKQAFITAYNGYMEATFEVEYIRTSEGMQRLPSNGRSEPFTLSHLAPVAAEIYRQLTGRIVVEVGSKDKPVDVRTLERVHQQVEDAGIKADVFAAQDIKIRNIGNEQVIRIIIEAPGEEAATKDGS